MPRRFLQLAQLRDDRWILPMTSIYLAGPDVFLPDAIEIGRRKAALCARYGLIGLYPLDNKIDLTDPDASLQIFRGNEAMMDEAKAIIANLTPFRGPSADAGTVYELGYMAGRSKLCLGYSNDPAPYPQRVAARAHDDRLIDANGHLVEDFGLADNLMMIHALDLHGCALVTPREAPDDLWRDLAAFEACVKLAAERLLPATARAAR
jgi:nucleoside 2-deoxyribosyltransferase